MKKNNFPLIKKQKVYILIFFVLSKNVNQVIIKILKKFLNFKLKIKKKFIVVFELTKIKSNYLNNNYLIFRLDYFIYLNFIVEQHI